MLLETSILCWIVATNPLRHCIDGKFFQVFWKTEVIQFQNVISGSGPNSLTALETGSFCNGKRCCGRLAAPWTW